MKEGRIEDGLKPKYKVTKDEIRSLNSETETFPVQAQKYRIIYLNS